MHLDGMESCPQDEITWTQATGIVLRFLTHFECPLNHRKPRKRRSPICFTKTTQASQQSAECSQRIASFRGRSNRFLLSHFLLCHRDVRELTKRGNTSFGKSCVKWPFYAGISFFDFEQQIEE